MKPDSPSFTEKQFPNFTVVHAPVVPQKIEKSNPAKKITSGKLYTIIFKFYFSILGIPMDGLFKKQCWRRHLCNGRKMSVALVSSQVLMPFQDAIMGEPWLRGW